MSILQIINFFGGLALFIFGMNKMSDNLHAVDQIAHMIQSKIKREGIAARNVFAQVIANREQWIYQQLNSIEVSL